MCTPNNGFNYSELEGKIPSRVAKPKSFIERIRDHNALNKEALDPVGYPETVNHPINLADRQSGCQHC